MISICPNFVPHFSVPWLVWHFCPHFCFKLTSSSQWKCFWDWEKCGKQRLRQRIPVSLAKIPRWLMAFDCSMVRNLKYLKSFGVPITSRAHRSPCSNVLRVYISVERPWQWSDISNLGTPSPWSQACHHLTSGNRMLISAWQHFFGIMVC